MSKRGFSLLEVLVASSIGIILLSIIVGIWVQVQTLSVRAREQAALEREVAFAGRLIDQDLRRAGLGVPQGGHIQHRCNGAGACTPTFGTVPPARFYASVIVAAATEVGILGDVTRPNAQYNTFGVLSSFRTGGRNTIAWHTENNGMCMPPACSTGATSLFFPGQSGCVNSAEDRQCPWGLNRVQGGDRIQIVAGNGSWSHAAVGSHPFSMSGALGTNGLALAVPFDRAAPDTVWPNIDQDGAGPGGIPGAGWVTTLDRVFFRKNGDVMERIQCWGDPDPDNAGWPPATAAAIPASLTLTPQSTGASSPANECTRPEVIARFVDTVRFRYFTAIGVEVPAPATTAAAKAAIHRIDYELTLKRAPTGKSGRVIVKGTVGSVRLSSIP